MELSDAVLLEPLPVAKGGQPCGVARRRIPLQYRMQTALALVPDPHGSAPRPCGPSTRVLEKGDPMTLPPLFTRFFR